MARAPRCCGVAGNVTHEVMMHSQKVSESGGSGDYFTRYLLPFLTTMPL